MTATSANDTALGTARGTTAGPAFDRRTTTTSAPVLRAFVSLLARDVRVLRRDISGFVIRALTQPLLFVFVFSFVLPKINGGGTGAFSGPAGAPSFATILVPGLLATAIMTQGVMSVTTPLVMELSYTREIEDRVLAPVPIWCIGVTKILAGAGQALVSAIIVFPGVMLIHAKGQAPDIEMSRLPLALLVAAGSSLLMASLGLLLGTIVEPRKLSVMFTIFIVPIIMLGCVYYPWSHLSAIRWMQVLTLFNPLVYVSEALRASLVQSATHLPTWALLLALIGGTALLASVSVRMLGRRLVD
jgi:ABC-2 type transport system permease protein